MEMELNLTVNGQAHSLSIHPSEMLADTLRERLGLIGTKIGCREGECGACTILLDGEPVNACMLPALKAHNRSIITIEGIGTLEQPHPLQVVFAEEGAVQCGYCTPGVVVAAYALLQHKPDPDRDEILEALTGNLCRCASYQRVVKAIQMVSSQT
jgi:aerobic-type carbon monoxide dehydrogenase small subunit (CoxS/CutS family)